MRTAQDTFGGGVAVITGAGAGIGEGLALHAALRLGMAVALADIDEAALAGVQAQIADAHGQAGARAHIWNLSSMGGVSVAPLQAPYIMSKHAVLALTDCLRLEMEVAGHDIQVNAVLPGAVTSKIFQSAGSVEDGDGAVAERKRQAMLAIAAQGMSPAAAAETLSRQAAAGEFYLLTQPKLVGDAMQARTEQLAHRRPPQLWRGEFSLPTE